MRNRSPLGLLLLAAATACCSPAFAKLKAYPGAPSASAAASEVQAKPVDINSAGLDELKSLPGIGDAEAARIVKGRPWRSKAQLVVDKAITEATYHTLKRRIVAVQTTLPKPARTKRAASAVPTSR